MVDLCSLTLTVWTVSTNVLVVHAGTFIEVQAKAVEHLDDGFNAAFHSAFQVGIFNTQEEYAVALMSQTFINQCREQIAQMHEAGWAWCNSGNFCAFRQVSCRIAFFNIFRSQFQIWEQQLR